MVFLIVNAVIILLCVLAIWKPATAFGSAISVFSFEQWAQVHDSYFAQNSSFLNIAQGVIVLLAVMGVAARMRNPLQPFPVVSYYIIGLLTLALVSCLWSINFQLSFYLYQDAVPYLIAFVLLLPLTINCTDDVRVAVVSALVTGTIVLLLIQFGTELHRWGRSVEIKEGIVTKGGEVRTRATPLAPATLAGHIIVMICLMNFRKLDRIWYLLLWGVAPLGFWVCIRSDTRGQYFASILVVVVLFGVGRGVKRIGGLAFGAMVAGAIIAFGWYFLSQFGSSGRWGLSAMVDNYMETRFDASLTMLRIWMNSSPHNVLLGLGSSTSFDPNVLDNFPHVLPVEILCQLGLPGLTIYTVAIILVFMSARRTLRLVADMPPERGLLTTLFGLFLFELLRSMKEWPMLYHVYLFSFGIMVARFELLVRREVRERHRKKHQQMVKQVQAAAVPVGAA